MRVMAQVAMVMALDKCIGCHTCSVTCKQAWTNRAGTEYVWFNNVETRPGQGYPRRYEDQEKWKGGWVLNKRGRLELKSGNRFQKLFTIFASPIQPELNDYYEPWTYDYQNLTSAPLGDDFPAAKPVSLITGEDTKVEWGMNWDDNLAGATEYGHLDPLVEKVRKKAEDKIKFEFEQTFMFYLPRICEHCLNPSCMASCPSGAIYKRAEDGIVLVDQDRCRGWRQCITGCPYKKVYFNHKTGKAEKCTFCYPRIEAGIPTVCAETCVGRMRYIGIFLYDADRVTEAASVEDEKDLYEAQLSLMLDPSDPAVIEQARKNDIPDAWITAAQKSPVYKLAKEWKVALPLHPEYRTMPMVWYIPPLSPVVDEVAAAGLDGENYKVLLTAVSDMRIPLEYLAGLFTAGETNTVELVLRRLAAMRSHMRDVRLGREPDPAIAAAVGLDGKKLEAMYRLLAIAKYDDRYVIPTAKPEVPRGMESMGNDVKTLLGEGAPAGCHPDVASFHGQGGGGINNGPVSLPLPTVRREPVPAAGPGMTPVGVPEPVGQAPAADSSTGPAVAAPRDL